MTITNFRRIFYVGNQNLLCRYSDIGGEAYGKFGRHIASFSVLITLVGVAIVFLILTGRSYNNLM
jgi:hypothetical protein